MENAQKITETEKNIRRRTANEEFIKPENCSDKTLEGLSPSGKYKLLIRSYSTGEGSWNYSRGTVTRVSDGSEVCDIVRNYSFTHCFVTKNGVEYLITGRSYTSQTIVNLETGQDMEPQDFHYEGHGFCWTGAVLSPDGNTLLVDGCHWAAPYEFRFYDFTDPENKGWAALPVTELAEWEKHKDDLYDEDGEYRGEWTGLQADCNEPEFNDDGTITVYETAAVYTPTGEREYEISSERTEALGEAYDDESNWDRTVDVKLTLERRGDILVVLDTWKSEWQEKREAKNQAYRDKQAADFKHWKETDEFLKVVRATLEKDPDLKPLGEKIGMCGSSGNARKEGEKNMWFFNPYIESQLLVPTYRYEDDDHDYDAVRAKLKWGTIDGDSVFAELINCSLENGTQSSKQEFPKTPEGLAQALDAIRGHLK